MLPNAHPENAAAAVTSVKVARCAAPAVVAQVGSAISTAIPTNGPVPVENAALAVAVTAGATPQEEPAAGALGMATATAEGTAVEVAIGTPSPTSPNQPVLKPMGSRVITTATIRLGEIGLTGV